MSGNAFNETCKVQNHNASTRRLKQLYCIPNKKPFINKNSEQSLGMFSRYLIGNMAKTCLPNHLLTFSVIL